MKKLILIMGLLLYFQIETMAQQDSQFAGTNVYNTVTFTSPINTDPAKKDYEYYIRKKKNNHIAGLVTLGTGLLLSGIGLITATNNTSIDSDATAPVFFIAGAVSGIASIPLMIIAHVYGHRAKLELSKQKTGFGVPPNVSKDITGFTLTLPGK